MGRLPVLLLAILAAVVRDQAAAAGVVRGNAGDGSFGGAAVGVFAKGGRRRAALFLFSGQGGERLFVGLAAHSRQRLMRHGDRD